MSNLVWLRRNLRLDDNRPLFEALRHKENVQLVFILDSDILSRFPNPDDRRVKFIKNTLRILDTQLKTLGRQLIVVKGRPQELIPQIVRQICAKNIFVDEDFETSNIQRDLEVKKALEGIADFHSYTDHLIFRPQQIVKSDGTAFQVYTPYMKAFRARLSKNTFLKYDSLSLLHNNGVIPGKYSGPMEDTSHYIFVDEIWDVSKAHEICDNFIKNKISTYQTSRDYFASNGTSKLSPYLRFGLISIRELFRKAYDHDSSFTWINELIWREFYASILYHFPWSVNSEFNKKYSNIPWNKDAKILDRITNAETGYPIIDAAIKELVTTGWMHNRARMIVASFWTKNLLLDWRLGDEFFAQYLMDYDLASNIGGWQWAASCGTDAQPYFRIFNPMLQGEKFDPQGEYIKQHVISLRNIPARDLHNLEKLPGYIPPIVDYKISRENAISVFKKHISS